MSDRHVIVIAEAGVNHNGDFNTACRLIHAAAESGADYVKFQTAVPGMLVAATAPKAEYQKAATGADESQLDMLSKILLPQDDFARLAEECKRAGIKFLSTPFDSVSIETLDKIGMDYWKIPSGEITNLPYLRNIASRGGKIILSTGMSTLAEVEKAVEILESGGIHRSEITLLHCNTQYPTPMRDVNLLAMKALERLGCGAVGYSDHSEGIEIPVAAVAMGAEVIEKHFTLDKSMVGPDHKASLDPDELKAMVKAIRNVELALGDGIKRVSDSESPNKNIARKSIVASRHIRKGELLTPDNITVKRPGCGISPMEWDNVTGTQAIRDFDKDDLIEV